jgi:hypothetical protein
VENSVSRWTRPDLARRIEEVLKPTRAQTFFPQPSVETFHPRILRRLARLDVHHLDVPLYVIYSTVFVQT